MAAGYDISASAASSISQALTQGFQSGIYFNSNGSGGLDQQGSSKAGDATSTAARSLQQAVTPDHDSGVSSMPIYNEEENVLPGSQFNIGQFLPYILLGGFALIAIAVFKRS